MKTNHPSFFDKFPSRVFARGSTLLNIIALVIVFSMNSLQAQDCALGVDCGADVKADWGLTSDSTFVCEGEPFAVKVNDETTRNDIDRIIWWWGDGLSDTVTNFNNQTHTYIISPVEACRGSQKVFDITMEIYRFCAEGSSCHSQTAKVAVRFKPVARFDYEPVICLGNSVEFENEACNGDTFFWDFGDGTTSTEENPPPHTYPAVGTYQVTLRTANECGDAELTQSVEVINPAVAEATPTTGTYMASADTFIVCLGAGNAPETIYLDGDSLSLNENSYEWADLRRYRGDVVYVTDPPGNDRTPNVPDLAVTFSDTGFFQIILEVDNACMQPDYDTLLFRVLTGESLGQLNQADACLMLEYTPDPYNPNATYTINDSVYTSFPVTLGVGTYNVECRLQNVCGDQFALDVFEVFPEEEVEIFFPDDTTVCVGSEIMLIPYTSTGGTWEGDSLRFMGDSVLFNPETPGVYPLVYRKGAGDCEDEDNINITVEGVVINANDYQVCSTSPSFLLQATPANGIWSSTDCPACIRGDTFVISELVMLGVSGADLTYTVASATGCAGERTIRVDLEDPLATFVMDTTFCLGESLSADATGSEGTLSWFIDGQAVAPPPFSGLSVGPHTVKLEAAAGDCLDSMKQMITIFSPPGNVDFTATPTTGCANLTVSLSNLTATFDNPVFAWYLDDSLFSTQEHPDPLVLGPGLMDTVYTIRLQAGNNCNGQEVVQEVTVHPLPVPHFGPQQDHYCSGDTVRFGNNSFGNPISEWRWDYGNGMTSTDSVPLPMIYFADSLPGNYTVSLMARNDCGVDTFTYDLVINPTDVDAFFNINPIEGCVGEYICLTSLSTPGASLLWDFGDGNTATAANICHTYNNPGQYQITLKAFGCGFDSITYAVSIHERPIAAATVNNIICTGDTVRFGNVSTNAVDFFWDFGDGDTSTQVSPRHRYNLPGNYTARLVARSIEGCTDSTTFTIEVLGQPNAGFTIAGDSICSGIAVDFINTSSPAALSYLWNFGDGVTSTETGPSHVFDTSGSYIISLITTNANGCRDTAQQLLFVTPTPIASFTYETDRSCSPVIVTFTDQSGDVDSYQWDFGDGTSSDIQNPVHPYNAGGNYTIRLVTTKGRCSAFTQTQLTVNQTPMAELLTPLGETGCAPFLASFDNNSIGTDLNVRWDFGDGTFSFEDNPTHTFLEPDTYTVQLYVNDGLCQDSITTEVEVFEPVEAKVLKTDNLCYGDTVGGIELEVIRGTPVYSYAWSTGQMTGQIGGLAAGEYTCTITDANGCQDTVAVSVLQPELITFIVADSSLVSCYGGRDGAVIMRAAGGVPGYDYAILAVSDGRLLSTDSTLRNVPAGSYLVRVTDQNGCTQMDTIKVFENGLLEAEVSLDQISCFGENDGRIRVNNTTGGVRPYQSIRLSSTAGYLLEGRETPVFPNLSPGSYTLAIIDSLGCSVDFDYEIFEPDSIYVTIGEEAQEIKLGDSLWLWTDYLGDDPVFEWFPAIGLSDPGVEDPYARPFETTVYEVKMTDAFGCIARDTIRIEVDIFRNVYIPNSFTPNADGLNDQFRILTTAPAVTTVEEFQIFDRQGGKLFEAKNYDPKDPTTNAAWDGRFRGKLLSPGQYVYFAKINYMDGVRLLFHGELTLIR